MYDISCTGTNTPLKDLGWRDFSFWGPCGLYSGVGKQHVRAWDMKSGLWYCQCCDPSPTLEHKREAKLRVTTSDRSVSGSGLSQSQWKRIETGHSGRGRKGNNGERRRKFARSAALRPLVTTLGRSVARAAKPSSVGTLFDCRLCLWKAEICLITHTGHLFNRLSTFSMPNRKMNRRFLWWRTSWASSSCWL